MSANRFHHAALTGLLCTGLVASAAALAADIKPAPRPPAAAPKTAAPKAPAAKAPAAKAAAKAPEVDIPGPEVHPADVELGAPASGADLTIYTNNVAQVRERRAFHTPAALTRVTFNGVPRQLQPETAVFQVLKGGAVKMVEQNFDFDVLTREMLLERSVGHEVTIAASNSVTGAETLNRARVLSTNSGGIVEMGGKIYAPPPGRIVFDSLPAGVRATPALVMTMAAFPNQDIEGELSYLTGGMTWRADYVVQYDADAGRMDFNAWASITNTSGMDFRDARIKLVAGAVKRVTSGPVPQYRIANTMAAPAAPPPPLAEGVSGESFVGNHIYTMERPTTLGAGETKQLALLSAQGVIVKRDLTVRGDPQLFMGDRRGRPENGEAETELSFKNTSMAKLGVPLPAGIMRIYSADAQGAPQFVGESRIDHVAEGDDVNLDAGHDHDVPFTREQVGFLHASDTINISSWRITIRNAKPRPVPVKMIDAIPGSWEITKENQSHTKTDDGRAQWDLIIPPKGQFVIEYTVKTQM